MSLQKNLRPFYYWNVEILEAFSIPYIMVSQTHVGAFAITIDHLRLILNWVVNQDLDFTCCDSEPATLGSCIYFRRNYTVILRVTKSSAEHPPAHAGGRRTPRISPLGHLLSLPNRSKSPFSPCIPKSETLQVLRGL